MKGNFGTNTFCFVLFVLIEIGNVVKPNCVQFWHGRPCAVGHMQRKVYSIKSSAASIHFVAVTKIPGHPQLITVPPIIAYVIIIPLVPLVQGAVE